jgi:hypothetical protein
MGYALSQISRLSLGDKIRLIASIYMDLGIFARIA